jgi:hypothetical protein
MPNGYVLITNNYIYWLLSLQSWTFGTKYLWSGALCSANSTWLSLDCVKWMGWIGGSFYAILLITYWCILIITFPGYKHLIKLQEWYDNTYIESTQRSVIIWVVFNTVSTIITIIGINKMLKTMQQLKNNNARIKTNYCQLTLHAFVLTLNLMPMIVLCLPNGWLTHHQLFILGIILIGTESLC